MTDQEWLDTPPAYRPKPPEASSYGPYIIPTVVSATESELRESQPMPSSGMPPIQSFESTPNNLD
jgi:hypothetical protein